MVVAQLNSLVGSDVCLLGCRAGGQLIWIAPSGGRDRPDPATGKWGPVSPLQPPLVTYALEAMIASPYRCMLYTPVG